MTRPIKLAHELTPSVNTVCLKENGAGKRGLRRRRFRVIAPSELSQQRSRETEPHAALERGKVNILTLLAVTDSPVEIAVCVQCLRIPRSPGSVTLWEPDCAGACARAVYEGCGQSDAPSVIDIKLTWKYSQTTVEFLDLQISKLNDGSVSTDIFRKTTETNSLLHFTLSHPPKLKSSIPTGQFLFKNRGYPNHDIIRGYSRALHTNRSTLFSKSSCKKNIRSDVTPRFTTKFNSNWTEINQIFKKHWSVLLPDLQQQLTPYPSITWRRSQTLGDLLCQSHYVQRPPWGCFSCGNCLACRYILRTKEFSNAKGDKFSKIVHHITCDTEAVVYHASCPCGYIYVGMTTRSLKIRIQEHVRDIKNAITCSEPHLLKPIPRHLFEIHQCNPKGFFVRGIDHVYMGIRGGNLKQKLLQKETLWIVTLDTNTKWSQ
ncbi:unnamed protein product [Ranitomeya imitator]|uniref:GIY-YIG domain-containing protein n=1 Tax=Ranitomeya imitator TaxID=111125 RepID=A0ABN9L966_9NEOB|nr:unnamed protein product [Ranitomeya imitator]